MKRREFIDQINSFDSLISFCYEKDTGMLEDIYNVDELNEQIERDIDQYLQSNYWYNLRDMLNDIDDNGYYFIRNSDLDYTCVDEDFDMYKDDVLRYLDDISYWDDEDDDEDDDLSSVNDSADEPFSIEDLLFAQFTKEV